MYPQKTPHSSPLRASYEASFVRFLEKIYREIWGVHCTTYVSRLNPAPPTAPYHCRFSWHMCHCLIRCSTPTNTRNERLTPGYIHSQVLGIQKTPAEDHSSALKKYRELFTWPHGAVISISKVYFANLLYRMVAWALAVKLPWSECYSAQNKLTSTSKSI